jgi:KDO2-lipid IV(A) lauroyltransferase
MSAESRARPAYAPGPAGRAFLAVLAAAPPGFAAALGTVFGWLAALLDKKRGRIVRANLALCFPELRDSERRRLARAHFVNFGRAVFCALALGGRSDAARVRRAVTLTGGEHYERALAGGRRVILLAPHFVALELGWLRLSLERPMCAMYREPRRHLFHWAVHANRMRFGGELIEREANPRAVLRRLAEGKPLYYLPDIDPGHSGGFEFVPFFGIPAATVTALSRFARLGEAWVIPCVTRQLGGCRYEVILHPPLENFPGDDPVADAARVNRWIEEQVRAMPAEYFWVHRRFKTRPADEAALYANR